MSLWAGEKHIRPHYHISRLAGLQEPALRKQRKEVHISGAGRGSGRSGVGGKKVRCLSMLEIRGPFGRPGVGRVKKGSNLAKRPGRGRSGIVGKSPSLSLCYQEPAQAPSGLLPATSCGLHWPLVRAPVKKILTSSFLEIITAFSIKNNAHPYTHTAQQEPTERPFGSQAFPSGTLELRFTGA